MTAKHGRAGGKPCWAPTSCTMHRPSRIAAAASPARAWAHRHALDLLSLMLGQQPAPWVGTRTDNAEPTVAFFREVLGLPLELDQPGFWMLKLPHGSKVEVFAPDNPINRYFTTGPSPGSWSTTSTGRPLSCGPREWRSSSSPGSTTAGTPGRTSAPRTATSMSSPKTWGLPTTLNAVAEGSRLPVEPRRRRRPIPGWGAGRGGAGAGR